MAVLELNDPEHFNAISAEMADDMLRAVQWLRSQPPTRVKAVVLQGRGSHFCPGGNTHRLGRDTFKTSTAAARRSIDLFAGFVALRTLPVPVISAVHGTVLGGGMAIALLTDCIVASEEATFQYGELSRGLTPAGLFTRSLSEVVGPATAMQLYLRDEKLSASQARGVGLVQHVCTTAAAAQARAWRLAAAVDIAPTGAALSGLAAAAARARGARGGETREEGTCVWNETAYRSCARRARRDSRVMQRLQSRFFRSVVHKETRDALVSLSRKNQHILCEKTRRSRRLNARVTYVALVNTT